MTHARTAPTLLRGDARTLPLADESVDLIVTSPPYFGLRSYQDGGEHYAGQVGAEASPRAFIEALIDCTREMVRVLKPSGSIFVNLGDKYSGAQGQTGVVLDPFGGTGTTALVSTMLGRRGLSVDLSADYGRARRVALRRPEGTRPGRRSRPVQGRRRRAWSGRPVRRCRMTYRTPSPALEAVMSDPAMTEDNRIDRIRAVLSDPMLDEAMMLDQVNAILDSAPPTPRTDRSLRDLIYDAMGRLGDWEEGVIQPNNMDLDNYSHWRGVAADVAREVLAAGWTNPPAPRVWFPGDTVPAGPRFLREDNVVVGSVIDNYVTRHTLVEILPSPDAWQSAVDRARAEREES